MGVSTHVLDTAAGRPAAGLAVTLDRRDGEAWVRLAEAVTDGDGRALLAPEGLLVPGDHRLVFATGPYLHGGGFHPEVPVVFTVTDASARHHVPLLLSPFGYTTYRGS